jgi:hypothetical protein
MRNCGYLGANSFTTASKANQSFMGNAFRTTKATSHITQKRSYPLESASLTIASILLMSAS